MTVLGTALLGLVVLVVVFIVWASRGTTDDRAVAPGEVYVLATATTGDTRVDGTLNVIGFNMAYGRGPGGDDEGPWSRERVEETLDAIVEQIRDSGAHVVALQEVDFASARSHDIDEARTIAEKLGWTNYACALTWENNYVPYPYWPPSRHYGHMKSGQCVISRLPIRSTVRHRLPQPEASPFYYNWFYLHRAIQHVTIDAGDGRTVEFLNVHLEAFDTENRQAHVAILEDVLGAIETDRVVMVGDFNALPPKATHRNDFEDEPDADFRGDVSMERIYGLSGMTEAVSSRGLGDDDPRTFTFPADAPSRRLDYLFVGAGFAVEEGRVLQEGPALSDHRPVLARLRFTR